MDVLTIMAVGGALWKVLNETTKRRGIGDPVPISALDVETFTSIETRSSAGALHPTRTRRFDPDVTRGIMTVLRSRTARQLPPAELGLQAMPVEVFEIVPPVVGMPVAADVIEHATRHNRVALGSLSLSLLLTGAQVPMILVIGPDGIQQLAVAGTDAHGAPVAQFARLYADVVPVVETTADPVADTTPAPAATPAAISFPAPPVEEHKANGVAGPAKPATVVDTTAEVKEG